QQAMRPLPRRRGRKADFAIFTGELLFRRTPCAAQPSVDRSPHVHLGTGLVSPVVTYDAAVFGIARHPPGGGRDRRADRADTPVSQPGDHDTWVGRDQELKVTKPFGRCCLKRDAGSGYIWERRARGIRIIRPTIPHVSLGAVKIPVRLIAESGN